MLQVWNSSFIYPLHHTLVSSVKGLEHLLQILPQGIYNRVILCLESESIEIGQISEVFWKLGIWGYFGRQNVSMLSCCRLCCHVEAAPAPASLWYSGQKLPVGRLEGHVEGGVQSAERPRWRRIDWWMGFRV